jgi:hypothetical protein
MPTQYLADLSLSDEILAKHIEDLGNVGQSNGMMADSKGNIYLTDASNKMIFIGQIALLWTKKRNIYT